MVSAANIERATSWTSGKLMFLDTRLADAIVEANRYTRMPLILEDPALADLRINGVFRAGQPAEFARAIEQVHPIAINYGADGAIRIVAKAK